MQIPTRRNIPLFIVRTLAVLSGLLGMNYVLWRYTSSINFKALWLAIPLLIAETYNLLDNWLFILTMWRQPVRVSPPPPVLATVDIFITTYNEPVGILRVTAQAAMRIRWPQKKVYILDDGARSSMEALAREIGCGYIKRGEEWQGKHRHAKAGNINNALLQTSGEFILTLDSDQVPAPDLLEKTLGYFEDPLVAFVQTPQYFYNVPPGDPFGSDAPLFYGPILQGKDGWNAAFYCGSNAVLRREALMQLGLVRFSLEMQKKMKKNLRDLQKQVDRLKGKNQAEHEAIQELKTAVRRAQQSLADEMPLESISDKIRKAVSSAGKRIAMQDLDTIMNTLKELATQGDISADLSGGFISLNLDEVAEQTAPEMHDAVGLDRKMLKALDLSNEEEGIAIHALSTLSVTEDMATAMQLHAAGWKSVYHPDVLAYGLAPEDLGSSLSQRLRWAQGTIQTLLYQNPLTMQGLSWGQKFQYFATINSYFSGFASVIFLAAPIIFLFTGIAPVAAWSLDFFLRLLPYLIINRIFFRVSARGLPVARGEQYTLALFPLWIQSVTSVVLGKKPKFIVTPKQRQSGIFLGLIWPQILVILLTLTASLYGLYSLRAGLSQNYGGILVNIFWGLYNVFMLLAIVRAAIYKPPKNWKAQPPEFLFGTQK